mmetsp:Transcript_22529/g.64805  ORF Transcript_22529/g.64805 Transcript_22529/m.64805 type:complete len:700 (+) Transcript_22529:128-2227(+)
MCGIGLTLLSESCPRCSSQLSCPAKIDDHDNNETPTTTITNGSADEIHSAMLAVLADRGPDLTQQQYGTDIKRQVRRLGDDAVVPSECTCSCAWRLTLLASVLHMRGDELTPQPYVMEDEDDLFVLCWNGEVYSYDFSSALNIGDVALDEETYDAAEEVEHFRSDTKDIMTIISSAVRNAGAHPAGGSLENSSEHKAVASAMSHVRGEYSFICYHHAKGGDETESLYFGRDPLGRRSLLLAGDGLADDGPPLSQLTLTSTAFGAGGKTLPTKELEAGKVYRYRVDFANVLEMSSIPLLRSAPSIPLVEHDATYANRLKKEAIAESLVKASETFHVLLDRAVRRRVVNAPKPETVPETDSSDGADAASVGVLFSGGIDSVVLAAMCNNHVPPEQPIDLINVAFTSEKIKVSSSPDRAAALLSFEEMKAGWPNRRWRFIAVDVPYGEVLENEERVCRLIAPLDSTMDYNIATAFWFASRGQGSECFGVSSENGVLGAAEKSAAGTAPLLRFASAQSEVASSDDALHTKTAEIGNDVLGASPIQYTSKARVLLVGIGADEQLAGYGRHRSVYNKGGYDALRAELEMERKRIWTRNLGRDDRIISDHGKEARFPFLDEDVVGFLQSLDVLDICDMDRPQGEGDKMILRLLAKKIGVQRCSSLVKRAIQFGSRIAKCSDVDRFGSSRKAHGNSQHRRSNNSDQS